MKILRKSLYVFLTVSVMCGLLQAQDRVVIRSGTLIDVRDGSLTPDTTIVLEGDRIVSVSQGGAPPAQGATVLDAAGKYIIPGLIEFHTHTKNWTAELFLNHGVTTTIDLGAPHEWIQALKEATNSGLFPGPRLLPTPATPWTWALPWFRLTLWPGPRGKVSRMPDLRTAYANRTPALPVFPW